MPEMDQWSPNTMVKYGLSRVDSNGDIVSIWNFGELDRALREIQSDDEEDTVYTSAAHESGSVTNSYVMIDGELRLSARYSRCPICTLQSCYCYCTIWRPLLSAKLSTMRGGRVQDWVDEGFFSDF